MEDDSPLSEREKELYSEALSEAVSRYDVVKSLENQYDFDSLTYEQKMFVSVIIAEAGGEEQMYWEIVANSIMNRLYNPQDVFKNVESVEDVIVQKYQYSGYNDHNYIKAMEYLNNRDGSNKRIEDIINTVMPIYNGDVADTIDGAQWYYSPKSMVPIGTIPSWANSDMYTEVIIPDKDSNTMKIYKK